MVDEFGHTSHKELKLIELCKEIALEAHHDDIQRDRRTLDHVKAVADALEDEIVIVRAAAWLHAVVEDHPDQYSFEGLISRGVPEIVVGVLRHLTHMSGESYSNYIQRVLKSPLAIPVKYRDILHNLSCSPSKTQICKYARALEMMAEKVGT